MAYYEKLVLDSEKYGTNLGLMLYYSGYSRQQFCDKANISIKTLTQMLHNKPTKPITFKRVMKALNCTEPGNIIHGYYEPYKNGFLSLREARKLRLLTQAELGKAVGKAQSYIATLESNPGKLTVDMHTKLAKALNMDKFECSGFMLR